MTSEHNIDKLDEKQKVNYIKNLLFNSEINDALDILLKKERKDLHIIHLILKTLDEDMMIKRIKQQCNLNDTKYVKPFVYSKIIATLSFYNKSVILNNLFKKMPEEEKRQVAAYEYQNKTNVSFNSKIFNKYCLKYKDEVLKSLNLESTEVLMLDEIKEKYNNLSKSKNKKNLIFLIAIFVILIIGVLSYKINDYNKMVKEYKGLIYPGIYLNNKNLCGIKINDLQDVVNEEKEKIENGVITVRNINGDYDFTYQEIGLKINADKVRKDIINYNNKLSFIKKVMLIKNNKKDKIFYLTAEYDDDLINSFMDLLQQRLNTVARNDGIVIDDNHNVYYDKGTNGFTLDIINTKEKVKTVLSNITKNSIIKAEGMVVENDVKYASLSSVNKKVSSYTTYFLNAGNRGHNISLASKRLNGTVLMPGDVFSYLKVVGPYGASNGYLPAPIYLNGDTATANGGGVCQLASTTYMAQLKAGLQTVSRRGHTFAPNYVPKGLDATVYSTTTDYKFKNNYDYPIYIVSYVNGNYLTVDIWTNENALGGKTFEPYSVASNGGYLAYLRTIKDGKVIETKYLDRSVYKAH